MSNDTAKWWLSAVKPCGKHEGCAMSTQLGVHLGERYSIDELIACAEFCDDREFDSVWLGEGRLARDGVAPAAVVASRTGTRPGGYRGAQ